MVWSRSSNVGDDLFWTGHPLAQANLYAFGRLAWDPRRDPRRGPGRVDRADLPPSATAEPELVRRTLHEIMDDSWRTYERYTAPLGVGFMVNPGDHYGPDVDGYEYTRWGTYHFADRDGVGVDRTPCVGHRLRRPVPAVLGRGVRVAAELPRRAAALLPPRAVRARPAQRVDGHPAHLRHPLRRCRGGGGDAAAVAGPGRAGRPGRVRAGGRAPRRAGALRHEWRDQINAYFHRKSGVPDERGRTIYSHDGEAPAIGSRLSRGVSGKPGTFRERPGNCSPPAGGAHARRYRSERRWPPRCSCGKRFPELLTIECSRLKLAWSREPRSRSGEGQSST